MGFTTTIRIALLAAAFTLAPSAIAAQPKPAPNAPPAPASSSTAPSQDELAATQDQLISLIRLSPTLNRVVEIDPTLIADQDYISRNNPQLAAFLSQHPEITRNPDFYLFTTFQRSDRRRSEPLRHPGERNFAPPRNPDLNCQLLMNTMQALLILIVTAAFLWLIYILLQYRRWNRVFRLQSDIHARLIERFASNQELLEYMNTEPGRRFLEAAPIPIAPEPGKRMPSGVTRILAPLQFGIVLTLLGIGLLFVHPVTLIGIIVIMLGLGFILSAIVSWRISDRLGLLPRQDTPAADLPGRQ